MKKYEIVILYGCGFEEHREIIELDDENIDIHNTTFIINKSFENYYIREVKLGETTTIYLMTLRHLLLMEIRDLIENPHLSEMEIMEISSNIIEDLNTIRMNCKELDITLYDGVVWGHADNEDRRMELLDKVEKIKRKYEFKKCEKELKYGESYNVGIISFVPFSENYGSGSFGFGASIITNGEYNNKKSEK